MKENICQKGYEFDEYHTIDSYRACLHCLGMSCYVLGAEYSFYVKSIAPFIIGDCVYRKYRFEQNRNYITKVQLISKCPFVVNASTNIPTKFY